MIPNQTNMTFFTDIDVNTTLDVNFKYYDITDFNKVTQPICQKGINYIPRPDIDNKIKNGNSEIEMKWIENLEEKNCNKIIGVIYRHQHKKDIDKGHWLYPKTNWYLT